MSRKGNDECGWVGVRVCSNLTNQQEHWIVYETAKNREWKRNNECVSYSDLCWGLDDWFPCQRGGGGDRCVGQRYAASYWGYLSSIRILQSSVLFWISLNPKISRGTMPFVSLIYYWLLPLRCCCCCGFCSLFVRGDLSLRWCFSKSKSVLLLTFFSASLL